ncbi:hypothetical protein EON63_03655 [archaeon]|nr:MAG: hypothetical protein EON63_03655 [archaeon]
MSESNRDILVNETSQAAEQLKVLGNEAFSAKDFAKALDLFTQAIAFDNNNAKYFVNRSLCHASLGNWKESALDARRAIQLDDKYIKAHCRLVKALIELSMLRDSRFALLTAIKDCGEHADLKALEKSIQALTGVPLRPKSTDFEILGELGEGNFSKVYKCKHKQTNVEFAIKVRLFF